MKPNGIKDRASIVKWRFDRGNSCNIRNFGHLKFDFRPSTMPTLMEGDL